MSAIEAAISAGGSALSSIAGSFLGYRAQKDTNEQNFGIAQYQNAWNEQMYERQKQDALTMWKIENEYNSPKETMKRMVQAGINPRAQSLGNFANAGNINQPSMPTAAQYDYQSPLLAYQELSNMVGNIAAIQQAFANVDKTKAETKAINVKALLDNALRMKYGDETIHASEKHAIWRYLHGFEEFDGGLKFPDISKARGSALRKYSADADNMTSKASYQYALARAMQENVNMGLDASGSWETNLLKMFMRHYYRNTQQK